MGTWSSYGHLKSSESYISWPLNWAGWCLLVEGWERKQLTSSANDTNFHNIISLIITDDEFFLWFGWLTKGAQPYFHCGPLSEILTIANIQRAASRIWTRVEPELRLSWMKLHLLAFVLTICTYLLCYYDYCYFIHQNINYKLKVVTVRP